MFRFGMLLLLLILFKISVILGRRRRNKKVEQKENQNHIAHHKSYLLSLRALKLRKEPCALAHNVSLGSENPYTDKDIWYNWLLLSFFHRFAHSPQKYCFLPFHLIFGEFIFYSFWFAQWQILYTDTHSLEMRAYSLFAFANAYDSMTWNTLSCICWLDLDILVVLLRRRRLLLLSRFNCQLFLWMRTCGYTVFTILL